MKEWELFRLLEMTLTASIINTNSQALLSTCFVCPRFKPVYLILCPGSIHHAVLLPGGRVNLKDPPHLVCLEQWHGGTLSGPLSCEMSRECTLWVRELDHLRGRGRPRAGPKPPGLLGPLDEVPHRQLAGQAGPNT